MLVLITDLLKEFKKKGELSYQVVCLEMAPWKLFSVTDTVKYKAFTCSWSILIISLVYVGLIAVPFLILFRIGSKS